MDRTITSLKNLTHLDISSCNQVNNEGIKLLNKLEKLTFLETKNSNVDISSFKAISSPRSSLKHLNIESCKNFTTDVIPDIIEAFPNLKYLNIGWISKITSVAFQKIASSNITQFHLSGCDTFTDVDLKMICEGLPLLDQLDISHSKQITSSGIYHIGNYATNLSQLNLSSCDHLNDECLEAIAFLIHLTHLSLISNGEGKISGRGIKSLSSLKKSFTWSFYFSLLEMRRWSQ